MKRLAWLRSLVAIAHLCAAADLSARDSKLIVRPQSPTTNATDVIELTGKITAGGNGATNVVFKANGGEIYPLVRNQKSEALFTDTNLWPKTLILKGRVQPKPHEFEVTGNLHSLRDGKRYELYYYCNICSIKTSEPGLCMCCREPVELVEEPE